MRFSWSDIYRSMKKSIPFWVTGVSLFLALWPLPASWNATVPVNVRLLVAVVMICGIVIFTLCDLVISLHHAVRLEEDIQTIKIENTSADETVIRFFINYNRFFQSATLSTIYSIQKFADGQSPVAHPLCNGTVIRRGDTVKMEVICKISPQSSLYQSIVDELKDYNTKSGNANSLVVRPFYEEVEI